MTLAEIEIKAVTEAILRHNGNKTRAAKELGVTVKTVYNIIQRNNLTEQLYGGMKQPESIESMKLVEDGE